MNDCLCDAILLRRLWTVENDVSNVCDNDIMRHHVSVSPGVSLVSCITQARKDYCSCCYKGYCWRAMLLNTCTNVFWFSVSTVLGEKDSDDKNVASREDL